MSPRLSEIDRDLVVRVNGHALLNSRNARNLKVLPSTFSSRMLGADKGAVRARLSHGMHNSPAVRGKMLHLSHPLTAPCLTPSLQ